MNQATFKGRGQQNFTRRSSLSDGWYSAAGSYRKGSEKIPRAAWVFVAVFASLAFLVFKVGTVVGF